MLSKKAFTLLEVLLSVCLVSIILTCVYATFWGGLRLNAQADRDSRIYREVRWSFDVIKKDLENMVTYDFTNSYPDRVSFVGKDDEIVFMVSSPEGLKFVRYYVSSEPQGKIHKVLIGQTYKRNIDMAVESGVTSYKKAFLMREESPFVDFLTNSTENQKQEVVSDQVRDNSLSFEFGEIKEESSSDVTWSKEWQQPKLPQEVKVTLDFILGKNSTQVLTLTKDIILPTEIMRGKK